MHSLDSNSNIPNFILKLWRLVNDESKNDLICWNRNGRSFIIKDQGRFAKEMLPLYFKHSNMASFIRQLNMYGFRKLANIENSGLRSEADEVEFFHHYFTLGQEDQLHFIKRKMANNKSLTSIVKVDDVQDILADVESIKGRQDSVDTLLNNLKQENEALWREIAILRQKHIKQQQIVEKLLQFLVSIVRNRVVGGLKRKASLLIDPNIPNNRKVIKTKDSNAICIAPSSSTNSPIIHDITELEDQIQTNSPPNSLVSGLQINMDGQNHIDKTLQSNEDSSLIPSNADMNSKHFDFKDTAYMPDMLKIELNPVQNQLIEHDYNENSSLNTPKINFDDMIISTAELMKNQQQQQQITNDNNGDNNNSDNNNNNNFSTDLILPSKQKTNPNLQKLTSENFNDHVEGIDNELNWLQDQLYGGSLNIDPSTILGLFSSDNQFTTDEVDTTSSENQIPKAIMDGKLIRNEENSNSSFFDSLDLNNISTDTKDLLSHFNDIDSFN